MKKVIVLWILSVIILNFNVYGFERAYTDVSQNHWVYQMANDLKELQILPQSNTFGLGSPVTEKQFVDALSKLEVLCDLNLSLPHSINLSIITRERAIKLLMESLELSDLATYVAGRSDYFIDSKHMSGELELALNFGWVSKNEERKFRPFDPLKREEMAAILFRVYQTHAENFDVFHSYYAIQSFHQADLAASLTDLSHGWARLEMDSNGSIFMNTSSRNNNEYHIPMGHMEAVKVTEHERLKRHLMIFVKDETISPINAQRPMTLTEYLISSEEAREATVDAIVLGLKSFEPSIKFDGILIDFEGLRGQENAKNFNAFLSKLRVAANREGLDILTAVHPARLNNQAYFDGYDFKEIGALSDLVILMAHDYYPKRLSSFEMQSGLSITPLAPINEIYDAISLLIHPLNGVQDPSKVLLQFSMDTVQWQLSNGKILNAVPLKPSFKRIEEVLNQGATFNYSKRLHSPSLVFENPIDLTRNVIWFENSKSIEIKARLAKQMGIGGLSVWRLGTIPTLEGDLNLWEPLLRFYN